jgi:hypothetical protein
MIRRRYYFLSVLIFSITLSIIISSKSPDFGTAFLFYTGIFFILTVSLSVFPYVYYNHLSELSVLNRVPKYLPGDIINIADSKAKFTVSIMNNNFNVVSELIQERYIEAKAVFLGHYLEFYQYSSPWVISYLPFLKIDLNSIVAISQGRRTYEISLPDLPSLIKCNYFNIKTETESYKIIVEQETTEKFVSTILSKRMNNQNL